MRYRVLGELRAEGAQRPVQFAGATSRVILGRLLLHAGAPVSSSALVDALWSDEPPPSSRKIVQNAVSALRRALAEAEGDPEFRPLRTQGGGYLIDIDPADLDLGRFDAHVSRGRSAGLAGRWDDAVEAYGLALDEWTGPQPLADLSERGLRWPELDRLERRRSVVEADYYDAALASGRHDTIVCDLEAAIAADPLHERFAAQLMLALYRTGRQADSLAAYRRVRDALAEEQGLDPGPELRKLERQILEHDSDLLLGEGDDPEPVEPGGPLSPAGAHAPVVAAARRTSGVEPEMRWLVGVLVQFRLQCGDLDIQMELQDELDARLAEVNGLSHVVQVAGGTRILWFGMQQSAPDDPTRAVRTASDLRRTCRAGDNMSFAVVGGMAVVSPDHEVTGQFLSECFAMLMSVPAGQVAVSESIRSECQKGLRFTPADRHHVLTELVPAGLGDHRGTPLKERGHELAVLQDRLADAVRRSTPQLIFLLGGHGVGKSRLLHEFSRDARLRGIRCLIGCNSTLGPLEPYAALGGTLRHLAGVSSRHPVEQRRAAVRATVEEHVGVGEVADELVAGLDLLVAGHTGDAPPARRLVEEAFYAWRVLMQRVAASEPLVLLVEDLDRVDADLLDFFEEVPTRMQGSQVMFVFSGQPRLLHRRTAPGGNLNAMTLVLDPLSDGSTEELVKELVVASGGAPESSPSTPCTSMLEHVGGNPGFALECWRASRGEVQVVPVPELGVSIPRSVHAAQGAQLDALSPSERRTLYDAAILGEHFTDEEVVGISPWDAPEVQQDLALLERHDVIRSESVGVQRQATSYSFSSELMRAVALTRQPRAVQAAKREAAARWNLDADEPRRARALEHLRAAVVDLEALGSVRASHDRERVRDLILDLGPNEVSRPGTVRSAPNERARRRAEQALPTVPAG